MLSICCEEQDSLGDSVAQLCYQFYDKALGHNGKRPPLKQWTNFSAFLLERPLGETSDVQKVHFKVVAAATGTKCLGRQSLSDDGSLLHDSHAEILARRAFQSFLLDEMFQAYSSVGSSSVFTLDQQKKTLCLRENVKIVFFTTQTPCGDASIFKRCQDDQHPQAKKRHDLHQEKCKKRLKVMNENLISSFLESREENSKCSSSLLIHSDPVSHEENDYVVLDEDDVTADIYRTGAKCVPGGEQDKHLPGRHYHVTGALRTKPGRGDPTLSMSCSDKIMRWNVLGCQGALLMLLMDKPVYIDKIVVAGCAFDEKAMVRAVIDRLSTVTLTSNFYHIHHPRIFYSRLKFKHSYEDEKTTPWASSIIWYHTSSGPVTEISVDGRRQGITKKAFHSPKARLTVCRREIFKKLLRLLSSIPEGFAGSEYFLSHGDRKTYIAWKKQTTYYKQWMALLLKPPFNLWITKDSVYSAFSLKPNKKD